MNNSKLDQKVKQSNTPNIEVIWIPETVHETLTFARQQIKKNRTEFSDLVNESYQTMSKYELADEYGDPKQPFPLAKAPAYERHYPAPYLLMWHAQQLGYIVVPKMSDVPNVDAAMAIKESAEAIAQISTVFADGKVDDDERPGLIKELTEAVQYMTALINQYQ